MRASWLPILGTGLAFLAGCSKGDKVDQSKIDPAVLKQEQEKLQGHWSGGNGFLTITGDRFLEIQDGNFRIEGYFTLDPTSRPKWIDWHRTKIGGPELSSPVVFHGIYELSGDELRVCFSGNISTKGEKRPEEFAKKPGSMQSLLVWRRSQRDPDPQAGPPPGQ